MRMSLARILRGFIGPDGKDQRTAAGSGFHYEGRFDRSEPINLTTYNIARLQELAGRHCKADASWRSRENEISRFKCHRLRKLRYLVPDIEHEMADVGILAVLPIYEGVYSKGMRISYFVSRCDPWADLLDGGCCKSRTNARMNPANHEGVMATRDISSFQPALDFSKIKALRRLK